MALLGGANPSESAQGSTLALDLGRLRALADEDAFS